MISGIPIIPAHAHTVCTRPSPQLWEAGPGDEANRTRRLVAGKANATKNAFSCAKILSNSSMAASESSIRQKGLNSL